MNINTKPYRVIRNEEDDEIMSPFSNSDLDDDTLDFDPSPSSSIQDTLSKNTCYVKAKNVAVAIVLTCKDLSQKKDHIVVDNILSQLTRSSTSVMANTAEGCFSGNTTKDKINKFRIASREALESISWITLLKDIGEIPEDKANELIKEFSQITGILSKSIGTMQKRLDSEAKSKGKK